MKTSIIIYNKEYECYVTEQSGKAKGTKYKAYGTFGREFLEAQESSIDKALKRLRQKAEIALD